MISEVYVTLKCIRLRALQKVLLKLDHRSNHLNLRLPLFSAHGVIATVRDLTLLLLFVKPLLLIFHLLIYHQPHSDSPIKYSDLQSALTFMTSKEILNTLLTVITT